MTNTASQSTKEQPMTDAAKGKPHRKYDVHAFRMKYQHHFLNTNGDLSYNPDQCVNVSNTWAKTIGAHESYGDAKDLDYSRDADWIANAPNNHPVGGDVVIWRGWPADALHGHTAVALRGSTEYDLIALSQNFPDGAPVVRMVFSYQGVVGWWRFRVIGPNGA